MGMGVGWTQGSMHGVGVALEVKGEGGLGGYQPGVYVPLKALFLVSNSKNPR